MFTCTGSEANDLALRLAQFHTGGTGVIVTDWAYHGVTQTTAACSPSLGQIASDLPHVYTVPAPRTFGQDAQATLDVGAAFAPAIDQAVAQIQADGVRPAPLPFDSLFTSDGLLGAPPCCRQAAVDAPRAAGTVRIGGAGGGGAGAAAGIAQPDHAVRDGGDTVGGGGQPDG